jgi:hypothetical protein
MLLLSTWQQLIVATDHLCTTFYYYKWVDILLLSILLLSFFFSFNTIDKQTESKYKIVLTHNIIRNQLFEVCFSYGKVVLALIFIKHEWNKGRVTFFLFYIWRRESVSLFRFVHISYYDIIIIQYKRSALCESFWL